ncbi:MAG: hypothetical protein EOO91_07230 [Pedobacter sp.]|nr:MAG: hypothetical protein EOO91_07230 [Pedobacter sp.]
MMRLYLLSKGVQAPTNKSKETNGILGFFIKDANGTICQFIQKTKHFPVFKNDTENNNNSPIATKINHVGFMVADLEKANKFYVDILGFKETWRGSKDGKNVTWLNLTVADGTDYLELMLYDKEQSQENMGVLNHISLEVENIFEIEKRLSTRVLPKNFKKTTPVKVGINKKRQINTFDSDSTRIEIMEAITIDGIPAASSNAEPLKFKGTKN